MHSNIVNSIGFRILESFPLGELIITTTTTDIYSYNILIISQSTYFLFKFSRECREICRQIKKAYAVVLNLFE